MMVKMVFHIPHYAVAHNGSLIGVVYQDFKNEFTDMLSSNGVSRWYSADVSVTDAGNEFKEELLTVFCDEELDSVLSRGFLDKVCKYDKYLQQSEYLYERNDVLVSVRIASKQ